MYKWITPAALSLAVFGGFALPGRVHADDTYRDHDGHRYTRRGDYYYRDGHRYYREGDRFYRADSRYYRTDSRSPLSGLFDRHDWDSHWGQQSSRARQVADRVDRLYRDGRLSGEHRDRAMDRLYGQGEFSDVQLDRQWLDSTEDAIDQWSHGAYYNRWRR
jgi:hypothetical protein